MRRLLCDHESAAQTGRLPLSTVGSYPLAEFPNACFLSRLIYRDHY
jgi:hypothetical protein